MTRARPLADRFWEKVAIGEPGECWPWQASRHGRTGYGQFFVRVGASPVHTHRQAWELAVGEIPDGLSVLHTCDNPPCCNPAHLFLGTQADNMADMTAKGRRGPPPRLTGERHGRTTLTAASVQEIRDRLVAGETTRALGREYGVSHTTIRRIRDREVWKEPND